MKPRSSWFWLVLICVFILGNVAFVAWMTASTHLWGGVICGGLWTFWVVISGLYAMQAGR